MRSITASASSGVRQPCSPVFGFLTRSCECWPPRQWIVSDDLAGRLVDVGDDVGDQRPQQLLARAGRDARRGPRGGEVGGEAGEVRDGSRRIGGVQRREARAAVLHAPQRVLPVLLELRRDQAVVGIAGRVAALRQAGFVERLPEIELHDPPSFGLPLPVHPLGFQRRLDRHGSTTRSISVATAASTREPPKPGSAAARAQVGPVAAIDRAARRRTRVGDGQAPAAAAASEHARQQRPTAATGLCAADPAVGVRGEQRLVPLELGPVDVALVVILDQDLPGLERLAVAVGLAGPGRRPRRRASRFCRRRRRRRRRGSSSSEITLR